MATELNRKLKILLLAPTSVSQGGIATWTKLLLGNSNGERVEYKTIDTSVHYRVLGGGTGFFDRICGLRETFLRLMLLLRALLFCKVDIVYFTCSPSAGFAFRDAVLIAISKMFSKKVIIHLHGGDINGFWGGGILRRFLADMGSKLADYIFVITRDCEAVARQKFGNGKVIYIPNFIDISAVNTTVDVPKEIDKDKFNIIHVAFQCREKGTFEIIEATKELPENVNILLIGVVSDDNRIAIEDAIKKNDATGKVQLLGARNKPQLWGYYKNSDLFLFPSYTEGFPNVIMEAMLYGLPILATDVGNIADMTDAAGEKPAAVLLEKSDTPDPVEMADKIKRLIDHAQFRKQLSKNGIERVKECYSLDVVIPQLERVLEAIFLGEDALSQSKKYFQQDEISN